MLVAILLTLLGFIFIFLSGSARGIFECVLLFDTVDDWLGPYWAFDLFKAGKDRNKDGKITFWELHFPNDGPHRIKLIEYILNSLSIGVFILAYSAWFVYNPLLLLTVIILPVFTWEAQSMGFLLTFNKFRYKPKKP